MLNYLCENNGASTNQTFLRGGPHRCSKVKYTYDNLYLREPL